MKFDQTALLLQAGKYVTVATLGVSLSIPTAVMTLVAFVLADFITGLLAAFVLRRVDSGTALRGFVTKCMLVGLVLVMHAAEQTLGKEIGVETWLSGYFIVIEVISIVENCSRAGVPVPKKLMDVLLQVQKLYPRPMSAAEMQRAQAKLDRQRAKARAMKANAAGREDYPE